ncbi:unnamed protein product [Pedinophyceae sp. YPF-701]|nr:unnamed protein product [Pedinophyceae sp. YPF-701]
MMKRHKFELDDDEHEDDEYDDDEYDDDEYDDDEYDDDEYDSLRSPRSGDDFPVQDPIARMLRSLREMQHDGDEHDEGQGSGDDEPEDPMARLPWWLRQVLPQSVTNGAGRSESVPARLLLGGVGDANPRNGNPRDANPQKGNPRGAWTFRGMKYVAAVVVIGGVAYAIYRCYRSEGAGEVFRSSPSPETVSVAETREAGALPPEAPRPRPRGFQLLQGFLSLEQRGK